MEEVLKLLEVLPPRIEIEASILDSLVEIVLDLGKQPEARSNSKVVYLPGPQVSQEDIDHVVGKVGSFTNDNRAGIERTLHRISCLRNRAGKIIGLTCRVGRAVYGTNDIIQDVIESGKNTLFLGPPGIGKTTKLREAARVLSDKFHKRVIIVDTSNEIAGDGDIPHPGIGRARRMQVASPELQHRVMIEAVENHMPEVIIVDEIGTEAEAMACRTIAERGVRLIGTAHGNTLENVISNPTLSDLAGGIQSVILGDEEARRRRTQKAILERKAPPTFDIAVEIQERDKFAIYPDVAGAVDGLLRGRVVQPEIRVRGHDGKIEVQKAPVEMPEVTEEEIEEAKREKSRGPVKIYAFGVNRGNLERAIQAMQVPAVAGLSLDDADVIITTRTKARPGTKIVKAAEDRHIPVQTIKKNVPSQINKFLKYYFGLGGKEEAELFAMREVEEAIQQVLRSKKTTELSPQNAYVRRLQHQAVEDAGLYSESVGDEPRRRLRIYP